VSGALVTRAFDRSQQLRFVPRASDPVNGAHVVVVWTTGKDVIECGIGIVVCKSHLAGQPLVPA
jgi:hypothetical protein